MSQFAVLLLAAGKSSRFGDAHYKKPFVALEDRAVWIHSAERFGERDDVAQVVLVIAPEDREEFQRKFGANLAFMNIDLALGGETRSDSVRAGLGKIGPDVTHIAVHDAARPCVSDPEIDHVFAAAVEQRAAILATPVAATLKRATNQQVEETVPREGLWAAQTPQVFAIDLLREAYAQSEASATDDAQLVEQLGQPVTIVEGATSNIKITTQADLQIASAILRARPRPKPSGNPFANDDLWR